MSVVPIVALDVPSMADAISLVDRLGDDATFYKVGNELFTAVGPEVVRALTRRGKQVFLDLKLHDIPNTVRRASQAAARLGVSLLTVHASGGRAMLRAAVEGAGEGDGETQRGCGILAVSVLTSLDAPQLGEAWGRGGDLSLEHEVVRLAALTTECKAHGLVCSGHEVAAVRGRFGDRLAVLVPGIRFIDGESNDQARVITPERAAAAGARYLVLGRAVTSAPDPRAAMDRVRREISAAV